VVQIVPAAPVARNTRGLCAFQDALLVCGMAHWQLSGLRRGGGLRRNGVPELRSAFPCPRPPPPSPAALTPTNLPPCPRAKHSHPQGSLKWPIMRGRRPWSLAVRAALTHVFAIVRLVGSISAMCCQHAGPWMTSDSGLERSESAIGWCSAICCSQAAAQLSLSCRPAADAVWSAPVWGSSAAFAHATGRPRALASHNPGSAGAAPSGPSGNRPRWSAGPQSAASGIWERRLA
jgi:hypothetical protein